MKTESKQRVMNYQTDSYAIVHHARYLEMMEAARWNYCYENDLMRFYDEKGIFHVIVNINIDYRHSARSGDEILIETEVSRVSKKSVVFRQVVYAMGKVLVTAEITNVYKFLRDQTVVPVEEMTGFWEDLRKS